jgi:hypothetical protein
MKMDVAAVLRNIADFVPGNPDRIEQRHNDLWHWYKHCFPFLGDMAHNLALQDYLRIGPEIGLKAAANAPCTYTKVRDNHDILVYWEPHRGGRGFFMVVRPTGPRSGCIATLFSPDDMKRYYDLQPPTAVTFH